MLYQDHPIFRNLDEEQLQGFVDGCEETTRAAGAELIARGNDGNFVYFLVDGELSVRISGGAGQQELARLHPPAVVGEMSMLTGHPRSANVVAMTDVKLLALPIETFQQRMADGDVPTMKIVCNMAKVLAFRLAEVTEKIMELESVVPQDRSAELQQFRAKLFSDWSS